MEKNADAFRTISEVAIDLGLPQHVLRFWETKFPQIKPLKRGGGRRYYRPEDVLLLRAIQRHLYKDGYTIRGVQQIIKTRGVRAVAGRDDASSADSPAIAADLEEAVPALVAGDPDSMTPPIAEPERLPDDFFERPVPSATVEIERWRLLTLAEELKACAKLLSDAQSRHADVLQARARESQPSLHSVDAP